MPSEEPAWATPFNVVASFHRRKQAEQARDLLVEEGIPVDAVTVIDHLGSAANTAEDKAMLRAEMQDEINDSWAAPVFFIPGPQARAAFLGTLLFSGVGAVVGLFGGLAWVAWFDGILAPGWRLFIAVGLGALAGGTIGFLAGGEFEPRIRAEDDPGAPMEDPRPSAERNVVVAIHTHRRDVAEHAADLLSGFGAERVDRVTAGGTPLPPQAAHPRPADPRGWWWKRAGRG